MLGAIDAERGVAARVGRPAKPDFVPSPRVLVEGLERAAHHHAPRARHVQLVPGPTLELPGGEALAEVVAIVEGRLAERRMAELHRGLVEPAGHDPPDVAVVGHVLVLEPVELALVELLVDQRQHGDARVAVLRRDRVAERGERRHLVLVEEPDRRRLEPGEHDLARLRVPVVGLRQHVVVGVAAAHLRRHAAALARQALGVRRHAALALLRQMAGAEVPLRHRPGYLSRFISGATSPRPPTSASDPGASGGGPMIML